MTAPFKIAAIAGSLRRDSYSRMVLRTVTEDLLPEADVVEVRIGDLPHYSEDLEREALPAYVAHARAEVASSDAVVIVSPEFNHGMPGVLKNALDWLSRPAFHSCMLHKPVLFMTIGPGALGGVRAQYQLRETLASMHCRLLPVPEIVFPHVAQKVADGRLADEASLKFLDQQVAHLKTFIRSPEVA
jgi:chromate reductase, NAD(P)H dehydrogenase (quinone)